MKKSIMKCAVNVPNQWPKSPEMFNCIMNDKHFFL